MSDMDEFDEQVKRLLCRHEIQRDGCYQVIDCPAHYKTIVAAALRKQAWINDAVYQGMAKEIDELKVQMEQIDYLAKTVEILCKEKDDLRREVEQLTTMNLILWSALTPEKRHELNMAEINLNKTNADRS
jgi:hypothetical protein